MTNVTESIRSYSPIAERVRRLLAWLDRVPHTVLALPLRLALATVFWNSAMAKLANWDWESTLYLFREVPLATMPRSNVAKWQRGQSGPRARRLAAQPRRGIRLTNKLRSESCIDFGER